MVAREIGDNYRDASGLRIFRFDDWKLMQARTAAYRPNN